MRGRGGAGWILPHGRGGDRRGRELASGRGDGVAHGPRRTGGKLDQWQTSRRWRYPRGGLTSFPLPCGKQWAGIDPRGMVASVRR